MAVTNFALDRCPEHYPDEGKDDVDCWYVFNFRVVDLETRNHPIIASHITFREAMSLVMDIPMEEINRVAAEIEAEDARSEQVL